MQRETSFAGFENRISAIPFFRYSGRKFVFYTKMNPADFWNERYNESGFAYGKLPNEYLKEVLSISQPASILFPAEGEGRNAVFAAGLGWKVSAFDQSSEGKRKAEILADEHGFSLDYRVCSWQEAPFQPLEFDAIALIFAHMPAPEKSDFHKKMSGFLKPGGIIILEAFSKKQTEWQQKNPNAGGPREPEMLYSQEEILVDFSGFEILELKESVYELREGKYHNGFGSVVRFTGRKSIS